MIPGLSRATFVRVSAAIRVAISATIFAALLLACGPPAEAANGVDAREWEIRLRRA